MCIFKVTTKNPINNNTSVLTGIEASSFSDVEKIVNDLSQCPDDIEYQSKNSITKESLREIIKIEKI